MIKKRFNSFINNIGNFIIDNIVWFGMVFIVLILILSIWYSFWQFGLCYHHVTDSWWYCFQHAFGR
jgi:hypothetical protein